VAVYESLELVGQLIGGARPERARPAWSSRATGVLRRAWQSVV